MPSLQIWPSTDVFEDHFGAGLGFSRKTFTTSYAHDFLFQYGSELHDRGWQVELCLPTVQIDAVEMTHSKVSPILIKWLPVRRSRALLKLRRTASVRWGISRLITAEAHRASGTPDVIYAQEYNSGRFDALLRAAAPQTAVIGSHHGRPLTPDGARRLRASIGSAALLTTLTTNEQTNVQRLFGDQAPQVARIPNAVNVSAFSPEETRSGVIMTARLFDRQKNFSGALKALAEIEPKLWAPLRIVGSGSDLNALQRLAAELQIDDHIEWCGFISDRKQLAALLGEARVFLMPSNYEGLPLAALEAQAAGCQVVASDIPAFHECLSDAARLVDPGDISAIATALREALMIPQSRLREEVRRARAHVETYFDSNAVFDHLDHALRSALNFKTGAA